MSALKKLKKIHLEIETCRQCPQVCGAPVHGPAVESKIFLVGQAPGIHEATYGRPFAYTAGKTLFRWIEDHTGVEQEHFRQHVYMAAVIRCFPGKAIKKGDRLPDTTEISNCQRFLKKEVDILRPSLILAVGKLAIKEVLGDQYTSKTKLVDVVGKLLKTEYLGHSVDVLCLPHPSGISTWPHSAVGKEKLRTAFKLLKKHPAWEALA